MSQIYFQYLLGLIRAIYLICAVILFLYGINSIILSCIYLKNRKKIWAKNKDSKLPSEPVVSVQLPIFNEGNLVINLLKHVCQLDYPKDKLQIQVLDDSTDNTQSLLKDLVLQYQKEGYWIEYYHRKSRVGFKAGNLSFGLKHAKGDFIVIFDADYEPNPEFIKKTMPLFSEQQVGFVQTRWINRNLDSNIITNIGGVTYDGNLFVEQNARSIGGLFISFSGSAGVWRKECLQSIGGWQWDTITEDIDASFRAQIKGWKGIYYPHALSKAELPDDISAFKIQQNRWAEGSAQNFRKHFGSVLIAKMPLKVKVMALLHLLSYVTIPAIPISLFLALPLCFLSGEFIKSLWWMSLGGIGPAILFTIAQIEQKGKSKKRLLKLPITLLMAVGISLDAFAGVVSGFFHRGGEFIRTPRVGEKTLNIEGDKKVDFINNLTLAEFIFSIYLLASAYMLWPTNGKYMLPWLLSSAFGLFFWAFLTMFQALQQIRKKLLAQEKE